MADNEQAALDDYITFKEIEDAYIELITDYKKLSKWFITLKNKHTSCLSIYEKNLRAKMNCLWKLYNFKLKIMI